MSLLPNLTSYFNMRTLTSWPIALPHSVTPIVLLSLAIIMFVLPEQLTEQLIYHHQAIQNGELWRLVTGHLLHTNAYHLLLNGVALVLLWALHGQFYSVKNYLALMLFCSLWVSLGLYFYAPQLTQYVGLSGVLHGLFAWGALHDIKAKDNTGYFLVLGLIIKIGHEQLYGANAELSELIQASVAIDAHLWGSIAGLLWFLLTFNKQCYNNHMTDIKTL
jgi:rhomboid family GlyGly-CTERM serine protease